MIRIEFLVRNDESLRDVLAFEINLSCFFNIKILFSDRGKI